MKKHIRLTNWRRTPGRGKARGDARLTWVLAFVALVLGRGAPDPRLPPEMGR